tara:strand:+ start:3800 stop:4234 length:435 start_codon:yes stop_codon:yes gene_type:complete
MEKKIDTNKSVFNKQQYSKTIDTNFNELGVSNIVEDIQSTVTVNDFFGYYNELFYDIPERGETNSHEFLIKTSGEYINFNEQSDIVKALQEEITALRELNLELESNIIELKTGEKVNLTPETGLEGDKSDVNKDILKLIGVNEL